METENTSQPKKFHIHCLDYISQFHYNEDKNHKHGTLESDEWNSTNKHISQTNKLNKPAQPSSTVVVMVLGTLWYMAECFEPCIRDFRVTVKSYKHLNNNASSIWKLSAE